MVGQRAAAAAEDHPGRGGKEHGIVLGDGCCCQAEHPAGFAEQRTRGRLEVGLEPSDGIAGALIQDDQVQVQATAARVGVPLHELVDQRFVAGRGDDRQHDGAVSGDGVPPQARLPQPVGGDGVRSAQRGASEDHGPGQPVEDGDVVGRQAQLPQFLPPRLSGEVEGTACGVQFPKVLGQGGRRLASLCRPRDKRDARRTSRSEADAPPQAKDWIEHRASSPGQAAPALQGRRVGRRPAAAQEAGPVGLVLHRAVHRVVHRRDVDRPDRLFVSAPRPAAGHQSTWARQKLRLQEQLCESRRGLVRAAVVEAHLRIAGQIELAGPGTVVDKGDQAHFRVLVRCNADGQTGLDIVVSAAELGPVGVEGDHVFIDDSAQGLAPDRPKRTVR